MNKQLKADLSLLVITMIWGSTFVLTKNALESLSTYNFLSIRFLIAFTISSIIFWKNVKSIDKETLKYGILIGFILFLGFAMQTTGLLYTTASKSGFISAFCIIIVPVIESLISKKFPKKENILGIAFAIMGIALLTLDSNLSLNIGDFYTLLCTFAFAFQIIAVGYYSKKFDPISLAIIQMGVLGALSTLLTFWLETPVIPNNSKAWMSILITGIFATSVAFIVQNIMQKYTSSTRTALIFTSEPVFSAIFAYALLGEIISRKGAIGCMLIVFGMIISEVDLKILINFNKKEFLSDQKGS